MNIRLLGFLIMLAGAANTAGLIWVFWLWWAGYVR